jgi:hypothetical protein
MLVLVDVLGGVRLFSLDGGEGFGRLVLLLDIDEFELESSSFVNVPCRTMLGFSWLKGE